MEGWKELSLETCQSVVVQRKEGLKSLTMLLTATQAQTSLTRTGKEIEILMHYCARGQISESV